MPSDYFKNKCLRVDLAPGEVFDLEVDCLQLQVRRPEEVEAAINVSYGDFDMEQLFREAFDQEGVPPAIREEIYAAYRSH